MNDKLTHFDESGASRMVDVGEKPITARIARASATVSMNRSTWKTIRDHEVSKGDVLEVARLAGIMAAKQTSNLIPLCHQLPLDSVKIEYETPTEEVKIQSSGSNPQTISLKIISTVSVTARTGVEMEALTAVSIAALTIYDMCKAIDRGMIVEKIQLLEKSGGRSGHFVRE